MPLTVIFTKDMEIRLYKEKLKSPLKLLLLVLVTILTGYYVENGMVKTRNVDLPSTCPVDQTENHDWRLCVKHFNRLIEEPEGDMFYKPLLCGYCFEYSKMCQRKWVPVEILMCLTMCVLLLYVSPNNGILTTGRRRYMDSAKTRKIFCEHGDFHKLWSESYTCDEFSARKENSFDMSSLLELQSKWITFQQIYVYPFIYTVTNYLSRAQHENVSQEEEMCYEVRRFQSYNSVPVRASPMRLAQSGFYATGSGDETRCYSCRMIYRDWRLMDHPDQIHRSMSPDCPHLNNTDQRNIPVSSSASDSDVTTVRGVIGEYPIINGSSENVTYQPGAASTSVSETSATSSTSTETPALAGLDISRAVYPQYRDVSSRLDSYQGWGWSHVQDPQVLARAGFYYAGYRDCVRCFYCGVGLRTWEREDDPWVEHVRWRSSCDYVRLMRGEQFAIQALANGPSNLPPLSHQPVASQTLSSLTAVSCDGLDVDARTRAIEMGFQEEVVDRALSELTGSQRVPGQRDVMLLETLLEKLMMVDVTTVPTTTQTSSVPNQTNLSDSPMSKEPISLQSASVNRLSNMESHTAASSIVTSLVGSVADDSIPSSETNQKTVRDGPDRNSHDCRYTSNYDQEKRHNQDDTEESGDQEVTDRLSTSQERQLEEENQSLRDESTCKICLDNPSCIVFLPCGHLVTCAECAPALRKCPICRALIRGTVRAHTVTNDNVSN